MAKFYIESGNFQEAITNDNYMEAVIFVLKKLARDQMAGLKRNIKLGPTISVSEMGYSTAIYDNLSGKELEERKTKYISARKLTDDIVYETGLTLFLPTRQVIDVLDI
jgi:hypothetical protein